MELSDRDFHGFAGHVLTQVVHHLAEEEKEQDEEDCGLELDSVTHAPLHVQEELVSDVFDLLESHGSCRQIILLSHRELEVIVVDVLLVALRVVAHLSVPLGIVLKLLLFID